MAASSPHGDAGPHGGPRAGRRFLAACLLVTLAALALRLFVALQLPNDESDDGVLYAQMGGNIAVHGVLSLDEAPPFLPTYIRMPGYPLLLAGVYSLFGAGANGAVRVVQAVADTGTCWLVAWLAWAWAPRAWAAGRRRKAFFLGLVFAAACPFTVIYVATILTETWVFLLGTGAVLLTVLAARSEVPTRALWCWAGAGLCAGLATLFRPDCGLLAAASGGLLVSTTIGECAHPPAGAAAGRPRAAPVLRAGFFRGVALTVGFAAALLPWTARNALLFQRFQPLAPPHANMPWEYVNEGYDRWLRTWVDDLRWVWPFEWEVDTRPLDVNELPPAAWDSPEERARVAALFDRYNHPVRRAASRPGTRELVPPPPRLTPELDAAFGDLARERIARHPWRYYVALPLRRAISIWFDTHSSYAPFEDEIFPISHLKDDPQTLAWLILFMALVWFYTLGGAAACGAWWRHPGSRRWAVLLALLVVPRLAFLSTLANPEPRYVVEFFPWLAAAAAVAVATVGTARGGRGSRESPLSV